VISDKWITILAIVASLFLGLFVLVLIFPPLLFGATSPVVHYAGLEIVRIVLFSCSIVSLFGIGPYLIYSFHQKTRLKDATNHYVKNKLQAILLALDLLEATADPTKQDELKKQIRKSLNQLNQAIKEAIQTDGRGVLPRASPEISASSFKPRGRMYNRKRLVISAPKDDN
jgi:hypothetical protein